MWGNASYLQSPTSLVRRSKNNRTHAIKSDKYPSDVHIAHLNTDADTEIEYDAIIIGSGMGGLTAASQMVARGAKVLVLEK
jgi:prolycopene isomerase